MFFGAERRDVRRLTLPCGSCVGCRLSKARAWAIRCMHEASLYPVNAFVTLTYEGAVSPSLNYSHFQEFMRSLRYHVGPTRFFMSGEYGSVHWRPHFHVLLFGRAFTDGSPCGKNIRTSSLLSRLWPRGFSSVGEVTYESAGYVARYASKKASGPSKASHYRRLDSSTGELVDCVPEFCHMSLRPGLGFLWFQKYWREVYLPRDGVVLDGGRTVPSPRYYDKLLERSFPDLRDFKDYERYVRSAAFVQDCTPARLAVRERCAQARADFYTKRSL